MSFFLGPTFTPTQTCGAGRAGTALFATLFGTPGCLGRRDGHARRQSIGRRSALMAAAIGVYVRGMFQWTVKREGINPRTSGRRRPVGGPWASNTYRHVRATVLAPVHHGLQPRTRAIFFSGIGTLIFSSSCAARPELPGLELLVIRWSCRLRPSSGGHTNISNVALGGIHRLRRGCIALIGLIVMASATNGSSS